MSNFLLHSAKARYQRVLCTIYSGMSDGRDYAGRHAWRCASFSAMTVRQIAREAQGGRRATAPLRLHRRAGEVQVFIRLIREMLDMPLWWPEDASWRERLFSMIGSEDGRLEYPPVGYWRQRPGHQSGLPANHDPCGMPKTVAIVEQASPAVSFIRPAAGEPARFIALVCGLDGIYALGTQTLDETAFSPSIR